MRTIQNRTPLLAPSYAASRTSTTTTTTTTTRKCWSTRHAKRRQQQLTKLRKRLKKAIDEEKIDEVREILSNRQLGNRQHHHNQAPQPLTPASSRTTLTILVPAASDTITASSSVSIDDEISADLRLVDRSITDVIETNSSSCQLYQLEPAQQPTRHFCYASSSMGVSLKRPASHETLFNSSKQKTSKTSTQVSDEDWRRGLRVDNVSPGNALHYASRLGKTCFIDLLLESGAFGIDEPNWAPERDTPLGIACEFGWLDTAKVLMARGADVNYENRRGKTPLILATELIAPYDIEMCKMLVENGAHVNQITSNHNDSCALLSACSYDNNQLIRYLIAKGAHVDPPMRRDLTTSTPLMRCVYNGNMEMTVHLLNAGANVNAGNARHETPLYVASYRGHIDIVRLLVEQFKADVNARDRDGDTPLSVACYAGRLNVVKYLLMHGACPQINGVRGDTPLHVASTNGEQQICAELLSYGANADALNDDNESVLHAVCRGGHHSRLLRMLLEHATQLDCFSLNDMITPFRFCIENLTRTRVRMARALLQAGADPNCLFNPGVLDYFDLRTALAQYSIMEHLFSLLPDRFFKPAPYTISSSSSSSHQVQLSTGHQQQQQPNVVTTTTNTHTPLIPIHRFFNLVRMIFKAGYRMNARDTKLFRESWMRQTLSDSYRSVIDELFANDRPASLKDLCRCELRRVVRKPLRASVRQLDIPTRLKEFLTLDIID